MSAWKFLLVLTAGCAVLFLSTGGAILAMAGYVGVSPNTSAPTLATHMIAMDVLRFGNALRGPAGGDITGLYNNRPDDGSAVPLGERLGLRPLYTWGVRSHCAYSNPFMKGGQCTPKTATHKFRPFEVMMKDTPEQYAAQVEKILGGVPNLDRLGSMTSIGGGLLITGIAFSWAVLVSLVVFILSGGDLMEFCAVVYVLSSFLSSLFLLAGVSLWTAAMIKAEEINGIIVQGDVSLGIVVTAGPGISLFWAAFVCQSVVVVICLIAAKIHLDREKK